MTSHLRRIFSMNEFPTCSKYIILIKITFTDMHTLFIAIMTDWDYMDVL